jgi:FkbM family methyltransferase
MIRTAHWHSFWRHEVRLRHFVLVVPSFDRWLYAKLHWLRLMGQEEISFLSRHVKPGMTVVDVGANIGFYSLILADLVGELGRVFAFEPSPALFEAARKSVEVNGKGSTVVLENIALGSQSGEAVLYKPPFNSGDNRLVPSQSHRDGVRVRVSRLDDILPAGTHIDWIKIDVQGWEVEVLRGMTVTLHSNPWARLYFEYWPAGLRHAGQDGEKLIGTLHTMGLSVFRPDKERPLSEEELRRIAQTNKYVNLVAYRTREQPS